MILMVAENHKAVTGRVNSPLPEKQNLGISKILAGCRQNTYGNYVDLVQHEGRYEIRSDYTVNVGF
jgi:hypothetical protein